MSDLVERLRADVENWRKEYMEQERLLLAAQFENERLLADAKRYRWIRKNPNAIDWDSISVPEDTPESIWDDYGAMLDAAIDAELEGNK